MVSELSLLGLDPAVLHQLLQQEGLGDRLLTDNGVASVSPDEEVSMDTTAQGSPANGSAGGSFSKGSSPPSHSFSALGRIAVPGALAEGDTPIHAVYELISKTPLS